MDSVHLISRYAIFCYSAIIQCVAWGLIYHILLQTCLEDTIADFLVSFSRALISMAYECFTALVSPNNTL